MTRETSALLRGRDLREALRVDTHAAHQRVDDAFSGFDLSRARGRAAFLRAQAAGLEAARQGFAASGERMWEEVTRTRRDAARMDGFAVRTSSLDLSPSLDPLGIAYVVSGSLHGTAVLRGRLARLGVSPMPAFFLGSDWKPMWADVMARVAEAPAARHAGVVQAAVMTFDVFYQAARLEVAGLECAQGVAEGVIEGVMA